MSKILVVDDDHDILEVVNIVLSMNGHMVRTIFRAEDIDHTIEKFSPELILLDVALGSADGRTICKRLKNSNKTRNIPVLLFSAHYDLVNNIQECNANGLITKPFDTTNLLETVKKNIAAVSHNIDD